MLWLLKIHEVNFEEKWSESEWIVSIVISNTNHELTTDTATYKRAVIVEFYSILKQYCNRGIQWCNFAFTFVYFINPPPKKESILCCSLFIEHYANNISLLFISFCKIVQMDWTISVLHIILWTMWVFCIDNPKKKIRTTCTAVTILSLQENKQNYHNAIPIPLLGCRSGAKNTSKCWQF